jgi:hypothetical protein
MEGGKAVWASFTVNPLRGLVNVEPLSQLHSYHPTPTTPFPAFKKETIDNWISF